VACLGLFEAETTLRLLQRSGDLYGGTIQIDVLPAQRENLATPHTGGERQRGDLINRLAARLD
jgi:hypothetical protein